MGCIVNIHYSARDNDKCYRFSSKDNALFFVRKQYNIIRDRLKQRGCLKRDYLDEYKSDKIEHQRLYYVGESIHKKIISGLDTYMPVEVKLSYHDYITDQEEFIEWKFSEECSLHEIDCEDPLNLRFDPEYVFHVNSDFDYKKYNRKQAVAMIAIGGQIIMECYLMENGSLKFVSDKNGTCLHSAPNFEKDYWKKYIENAMCYVYDEFVSNRK